VQDPDKTLWEIYTLDEDLDHRGPGQRLEAMLPPGPAPAAEPVVWEHLLGQAVPERALFADGGVDEVRLRGSLNVPLSDGERRRLLAEAGRVLRPSGRLFVHVLTAEKPYPGSPQLPGPAAAVRHVPVDADATAWVEAAGFHGVRLVKFDAGPCFIRDGVAMRETQLEAWKPAAARGKAATVVYKGPFRLSSSPKFRRSMSRKSVHEFAPFGRRAEASPGASVSASTRGAVSMASSLRGGPPLRRSRSVRPTAAPASFRSEGVRGPCCSFGGQAAADLVRADRRRAGGVFGGGGGGVRAGIRLPAPERKRPRGRRARGPARTPGAATSGRAVPAPPWPRPWAGRRPPPGPTLVGADGPRGC
jgi:hypothetical protein